MYRVYIVSKNAVSTYGRLWTITSPQALCYFKMLYCTVLVPSSGLPPPLANASPSYLLPVWSTYLASEVTTSHSPWLLHVGTREGQRLLTKSTGWRRTHATNGEFADCKRGNNGIIRKAINSLWDAQNWACRTVADILACYQCHIAGNWRSLALYHHNKLFFNAVMHLTNVTKKLCGYFSLVVISDRILL